MGKAAQKKKDDLYSLATTSLEGIPQNMADYLADKQKADAQDLINWIKTGDDSSRNRWVIFRVGPYVIFLIFAGLGLISKYQPLTL
jgi:hypothetical protein